MFPVLFALLSAAGAWMAWRRNPLYSKRSTLRSGALVLVAIAAVIGIVVIAVNLTINRSPIVMGSTIAAVIVFGALSLIFIVQAVTTPKEAKLAVGLPPSAKLVHIHRKKVYKWAKSFAILLACLGILAIAIPGDARYAVAGAGGIALLLAVILLPVMYVTARNFDRSLTAVECDPWAHWQYPPELWKQWTGVQMERMEALPPQFILQRDWRKVAGTFAFIAAGVFLLAPGSWPGKTLYVVAVCGAILAIAVWSTGANRRAPEHRRTTLLKAAPEVYFGHDGVFCDGVYTTWLGLDVYLLSASVDEREPRSLLLCFEKSVPNPYTGNQVYRINRSVLIPRGAENDIARLQRELTTRCPKAQIVLV